MSEETIIKKKKKKKTGQWLNFTSVIKQVAKWKAEVRFMKLREKVK